MTVKVSNMPYVTNQVPAGLSSSGFPNALCRLKGKYRAYWFSAHQNAWEMPKKGTHVGVLNSFKSCQVLKI